MNERLAQLSDRWRDRVEAAVTFLDGRGFTGQVGLILGSGLGNFVDRIEGAESIPYAEIPGYHTTSVAEHVGRLVRGTAAGVPVVVMQGRLHPYEGLESADLLLPTAVLACLGIEAVVVTNAAGGLNRLYEPGDLMVIRDQLDLHFRDPLRGLLADPFGVASGAAGGVAGGVSDRESDRVSDSVPGRASDSVSGRASDSVSGRVPDRIPGPLHLYDPPLAAALAVAAAGAGVPMHQGVYASMWGPAYEARAEIGWLRRAGCDAVGMSTAPEVALLHRLGVRVVGLSCITNPAKETGQPELSHQDVVEVGARVRDRVAEVLLAALPQMA